MLAPGDAAVLAHILRTDPHLHPPRHPDRLTTNTYLGPARSVGVTTDSHFSRGAIPISLNRQPRLPATHKRPHTSRPASPSDPGGFDTVLLAASTTTGWGCGNLRSPAIARSATTRQRFILNWLWPGSQYTRFLT